ncbi:MAG: hypothetical protein EB066_10880, partial [Betaproteobacteria bacterium]|nr:hypothetical protein [Betaproteobacteria bacterium]
IKTGELWIGTGGSLNSASRVNLGLTDTNVAKFYLTGGVTNSNNITVLSTNTAGSKVLGGLSSSGTNTFAGNVTNNNSGGVWLENTVAGGTVAFTGVLSGTGSVTVGGLGTVLLNTNNTYSAVTTINSGATLSGAVFGYTTNTNTALTTSLGIGTNTFKKATSLVINGGTIQYTGAGETNYLYMTVGTNGATMDASGTGLWRNSSGASSMVMNGTNSRTITFTGTNTGTNFWNGNIANPTTGTVTVAKTGAGNWEFGGSSTFTGGLDIYVGRIIVGGGAEITNSLGAGEVRIYNGGGIRASGTVTRVDSTNHIYKLGGSNYIDWMDIGKVTLTNNTTVIGNTAIGGETVPVSGNSTTTTLGSNTGIQESGGSFSLTKSGANS